MLNGSFQMIEVLFKHVIIIYGVKECFAGRCLPFRVYRIAEGATTVEAQHVLKSVITVSWKIGET